MTRKDDYSFDPFFEELGTNWYADDDLLRALLRRHAGGEGEGRDPSTPAAGELREWGETCSGHLRELAEESALPENRPRLRSHDAAGNRVDEIVLPRSTLEALDVVEGREGLGAVHGDPFLHYARVYLYSQNGEGGVACSLACTDGLVRVLESVGELPEHYRAVEEVRASEPGRVVHGAQFVTEIQGGSDVPANRTRAVRDGDGWRLHGQKWFCSNVNADHYLVTARPEDAPPGPRGIGLYLVPARRGRDGRGRRTGRDRRSGGGHGTRPDHGTGSGRAPGRLPPRNGHTVDRLKDKLGTRELATAELTFHGAAAVPVGPPERGLGVLLRHVLVPSRYGCVLFTAGALRRAERIAGAYAGFRTTFGRPIADYPRVRASLEELGRSRARSLAAAFRLLALWERARALDSWADPFGEPEREGTDARDFRIMLSLCKAELTRRATRRLHDAMRLLGGNGIEERFSPLPRLYRDAVIMETWEGPYDVLLKQALRDLRRYDVDAGDFAERIVGDARASSDRSELAEDLHAVLTESTDAAPSVAFGPVARALVSGFADGALANVGAAPGRHAGT